MSGPFAAVFLLLVLAAASQAQAQPQVEVGPRIGYEVNGLDAFALGGDVRVSTSALPVRLNASADYFFLGEGRAGDIAFDQSMWKFAANALFEFGAGGQYFTPYAGPGLSFVRRSRDFGDDSSDANLGLNAVGGADLGTGPIRPFAQAEVAVSGDAEPMQFTAGLRFTLGGM